MRAQVALSAGPYKLQALRSDKHTLLELITFGNSLHAFWCVCVCGFFFHVCIPSRVFIVESNKWKWDARRLWTSSVIQSLAVTGKLGFDCSSIDCNGGRQPMKGKRVLGFEHHSSPLTATTVITFDRWQPRHHSLDYVIIPVTVTGPLPRQHLSRNFLEFVSGRRLSQVTWCIDPQSWRHRPRGVVDLSKSLFNIFLLYIFIEIV